MPSRSLRVAAGARGNTKFSTIMAKINLSRQLKSRPQPAEKSGWRKHTNQQFIGEYNLDYIQFVNLR